MLRPHVIGRRWRSGWCRCVRQHQRPPPPFYHDGAARPITRPQADDEQKADYSGKKKRHTVKNSVLADASGAVPVLSDTHEGRPHDKAIADTPPDPLPEGSELLQALGFQGFTLDGVEIVQPQKKPRGTPLTEEQKASNRAIAQRRSPIEHIIASIKRGRIVKDPIRMWKDTARDRVMAVCCGLHNFRLRLCPWPSFCS